MMQKYRGEDKSMYMAVDEAMMLVTPLRATTSPDSLKATASGSERISCFLDLMRDGSGGGGLRASKNASRDERGSEYMMRSVAPMTTCEGASARQSSLAGDTGMHLRASAVDLSHRRRVPSLDEDNRRSLYSSSPVTSAVCPCPIATTNASPVWSFISQKRMLVSAEAVYMRTMLQKNTGGTRRAVVHGTHHSLLRIVTIIITSSSSSSSTISSRRVVAAGITLHRIYTQDGGDSSKVLVEHLQRRGGGLGLGVNVHVTTGIAADDEGAPAAEGDDGGRVTDARAQQAAVVRVPLLDLASKCYNLSLREHRGELRAPCSPIQQ